jgi:hypothetical protein
MSDKNKALDRMLKLQVDEEHRVVVVGTPDGLEAMGDEQVDELVRQLTELRTRYQAAGYVVTHFGAKDPSWWPQQTPRA